MLNREIRLTQLAVVAFIGAIVGILTFLIGLALNQYVFVPINCEVGNNFFGCADALSTSNNIALIVGGLIGLTFLTKREVYRPLFVVLASVVSLWGVVASLSQNAWWLTLGLSALMFAVCFGLFAWLSVFRRFWISLILAIVIIIFLRLALAA